MKRTFIAVKIEPEAKLKEMIDGLTKELRNDSIKWVDIHNMHLTIAFLGDTTPERVKDVSGMLNSVCKDFGSFSFMLEGFGVFRNLNDPRVIWTGIKDSGKLTELHDFVKKGLERIAIKTEERPFSPHLTLGRVKWINNKKALENFLAKHKETQFQKVTVSEVIFFESILSQAGPAYVPLSAYRL